MFLLNLIKNINYILSKIIITSKNKYSHENNTNSIFFKLIYVFQKKKKKKKEANIIELIADLMEYDEPFSAYIIYYFK
jgi:hypothetical protein